ncbi:hypothetical protein HU200_046059 [Digitaria exilis]|uniref:Uncharacterized protein n=1 Tax=Digitaria exilis TaxID=1010633 RepID=A0A835ED12_9POAL|nr:hypothetical protein HU200_046059 [Digitaria exilis]
MQSIRLPSPSFTFQACMSHGPGNRWSVSCFPLAERMVLCTDQCGRSFLYDGDKQAVIMPNLHKPDKSTPISLFGAHLPHEIHLLLCYPRPPLSPFPPRSPDQLQLESTWCGSIIHSHDFYSFFRPRSSFSSSDDKASCATRCLWSDGPRRRQTFSSQTSPDCAASSSRDGAASAARLLLLLHCHRVRPPLRPPPPPICFLHRPLLPPPPPAPASSGRSRLRTSSAQHWNEGGLRTLVKRRRRFFHRSDAFA